MAGRLSGQQASDGGAAAAEAISDALLSPAGATPAACALLAAFGGPEQDHDGQQQQGQEPGGDAGYRHGMNRPVPGEWWWSAARSACRPQQLIHPSAARRLSVAIRNRAGTLASLGAELQQYLLSRKADGPGLVLAGTRLAEPGTIGKVEAGAAGTEGAERQPAACGLVMAW